MGFTRLTDFCRFYIINYELIYANSMLIYELQRFKVNLKFYIFDISSVT